MRVFVLTGPTGVGKTDVAVLLAERYGLELVSADSRQVYSWLDIGTAKPDRELRRRVKFHMVDMVEPDRAYSAADYARDALAVMRRLASDGKRFMVVGGSGMYIRAVFEPFFDAPRADSKLRRRMEEKSIADLNAELRRVDPDRAAQLHPNDRQRIMRALEVYELTGRPMSRLMAEAAAVVPDFTPAYAVLDMARHRLHQRTDERFDRMLEAGLLDEVRHLRENGFGRDSYVTNAYGYAELLDHLEGDMPLAEAVKHAKTKTRAYARRQVTWCRNLKNARWFESTTAEQTATQVAPLLEECLADTHKPDTDTN